MNRTDFLMTLYEQLEGLPGDVKADAVQKYKDLFQLGIDQGKTEEQISEALGSPLALAQRIKDEFGYSSSRNQQQNYYQKDFQRDYQRDYQRRPSIIRIFFMLNIMFFFNLICFVGPFFAIFGILIGIWGTAFGFSVGGLGALCAAFYGLIHPVFYSSFASGFSFTTIAAGAVLLSSTGILMGFGTWYVTKWFFKAVGGYIKWNFHVIFGR